MKRNLSLTLFNIIFISIITWGQHKNCQFHQHQEQKLVENPNYLQERQNIEEQTQELIQLFRQKRIQNTVYKIPVVVHIIYQAEEPQNNLSDSLILSQIDVLNEDYRKTNANFDKTPLEFQSLGADIGIEFQLATTDPDGNPTTGITRTITTINEIGETDKYYRTAQGGIDAWNTREYLNIWVCELAPKLLGFAYPPESQQFPDDGVVISPDFFGHVPNTINLGRTATHEIGHYFNLLHIWGNSGGCVNDDEIEDTPMQDKEHYGCPAHPTMSCGSADLFNNYMDYVDDDCMTLFTNGQKERMLAALLGLRKGLLTSKGLDVINELPEFIQPTFTILFNENMLSIESSNSTKVKMVIFSSIGQKEQELEFYPTEKINLSALSSGIYILKIQQNDLVKSEKIVIE